MPTVERMAHPLMFDDDDPLLARVRGLARDIATSISTPERVAELETARAALDADLWRELGGAGLLGLELSSETAGDAGGDLGGHAVEGKGVGHLLLHWVEVARRWVRERSSDRGLTDPGARSPCRRSRTPWPLPR